ncbi:hypothetical protein [Paraburkholderia adhaesiva]|uniref:hypothetical protein n=1 Tax=Paraburkholderia adhaesiva TaxID=2883244 RepID=UPI001F321B38|nr:hypothetical protein [Paraburkholderia adhaesiva]
MSFDQIDHFVPDAWFGTPVFSVVGRNELYGTHHYEKFEKRTRYFNYLPRTVTVIERNGLCVEFPPLDDATRNAFVIQTDWRVHRSLQTRFLQLLKESHENEPRSLLALRECLKRYKVEPYDHWVTFRCELVITLEDLKEHRGEIYDHQHDVVVSLSIGIDAGPHPFSESGRILKQLESTAASAIKNAYFESIRIIDNEGKYGDRYINRDGDVIQIKSTEDPTLEDGVLVVRPRSGANKRRASRIGWRRYSFEEADEKLELYKSYADAENYGDSETRRKKDLAAQEAELAQRKHELKEQSLAHQEKLQQWEREKAEFQQDLERRQFEFEEEARQSKREADRAKYYYEQQLLEAKQRKDMNDWLKQLPGIMSAVALAWLTYKTAKLQTG